MVRSESDRRERGPRNRPARAGKQGVEQVILRYQLRIISGALKGRKLTVPSDPGLRPMADRARESLFSILGDAVPDRPFFDLFAGTGVVGLEALSRGASSSTFVERDHRLVS